MSLLFALVLYIAIGEVAKLALVKNTRKISYEFFLFGIKPHSKAIFFETMKICRK